MDFGRQDVVALVADDGIVYNMRPILVEAFGTVENYLLLNPESQEVDVTGSPATARSLSNLFSLLFARKTGFTPLEYHSMLRVVDYLDIKEYYEDIFLDLFFFRVKDLMHTEPINSLDEAIIFLELALYLEDKGLLFADEYDDSAIVLWNKIAVYVGETGIFGRDSELDIEKGLSELYRLKDFESIMALQ